MIQRALRVLEPLLRGRVVRGVLTIMGGHVIGQAVAVLLLPALTRLYSPEDFGILAVYTSLIGLIGVAVGLRYDAAIPIPRSSRTASELAYVALLSCLCVCAMLVAAWVLGINGPLATPGLQRYQALGPYVLAGVSVYGIYEILLFWSVRLKRYKAIALMRSVFIIGTVLAQLVLAFQDDVRGGLVLGQLFGYVASCIAVAWFIRSNHPFQASIKCARLRLTAVRFRRFPLYSCGAELLVNAAQTVPPLLLVYYYGDAAAGLFLLAWRTVGTPLTLLVVPTARVFLAETSRLAAARSPDLMPFLRRTVRKLLLFATAPVAILAASAPTLFPLFFGARWKEAGVFCSLLCPTLLCHLVSISIRPLFDVLNRQSWNLLGSFALAALMVGAIILSHAFHLSATFAIAAMSLGGVIAHTAIIALVWSSTRTCTRNWAKPQAA